MEQYLMPAKLDFKNLRFCLNNYFAQSIYIRLVGSCGGTVEVDENLENKVLDFEKNKSGLYFFIDKNKIFHFPMKYIHNGFSIAYNRFEIVNGEERMLFFRGGIANNPYDASLPEPKSSTLRHIFDNYLLEIDFKGRINIKFHSWRNKPHWKYWSVTK